MNLCQTVDKRNPFERQVGVKCPGIYARRAEFGLQFP